MARKFRKGCPKRPYARFARPVPPARPAYCPCCWTDWTVAQQFKSLLMLVGQTDPEWAGRLARIGNLWP